MSSENLTYKQMRTIGYSITKTALKLSSTIHYKPTTLRLSKFIEDYIARDKTAQKAMRESNSIGISGFWAGVREARKEHDNPEYVSPIFETRFQMEEMLDSPERYGLERSK